jgi:hypothetical protein
MRLSFLLHLYFERTQARYVCFHGVYWSIGLFPTVIFVTLSPMAKEGRVLKGWLGHLMAFAFCSSVRHQCDSVF